MGNEKKRYEAWRAGPLSENTRRCLFAVFREKGLDGDLRHEVQKGIIGKESLRDFTEADGQRLIEHLRGSKPKLNKNRTARSDSIIEIATADQLAYIRLYARNTLGWKLGWNDGMTECESISKIIAKHTTGRKREIRLLTKYEARAVIETLKKIYERKQSN